MSTKRPVTLAGDSSDDVRSLPPRPNLEFERKQAKALLRRLRAGDPEARDRARSRHAGFRNATPDVPALSDAQLIIAREYGFSSWPRLIQYFTTLERETASNRSLNGFEPDRYDQRVQSLLSEHGEGRAWVGRAFAAFVPRFYGQSIAQVLASPVTVEDARLVVARQQHCFSWDHLVEYAAAQRLRDTDPWQRESEPRARAIRAMRAHDLPALQTVVRDHPEVLQQSNEDRRVGYTLLSSALALEPRDGRPDAGALTAWLASQGLDLAAALNHALIRREPTTPYVQALLDRGADPRWMAPNGMSVLEHALLIYWNSDAVDLIARHATPRRALWIAAGLGDVAGVRRFFDRNGKLTVAAYRDRPPLELMDLSGMPTLPDPDDVELLAEAALVAALNGRTAVLTVLIDHGYPVDHRGWGDIPLVNFAIGHQMDSVVELLVSRGADLDLELSREYTARTIARRMFENSPTSARARRIAALCGAMDRDRMRSELDAPPEREQEVAPHVQRGLKLAGDDAIREGRAEIRADNLFIGLLRSSEELLLRPLAAGDVDLLKLRANLRHRLLPADDGITRDALALDAEARAVVARAMSIANACQYSALSAFHLASALLENDVGFAANVLVEVGANLLKLRAEFEHAAH